MLQVQTLSFISRGWNQWTTKQLVIVQIHIMRNKMFLFNSLSRIFCRKRLPETTALFMTLWFQTFLQLFSSAAFDWQSATLPLKTSGFVFQACFGSLCTFPSAPSCQSCRNMLILSRRRVAQFRIHTSVICHIISKQQWLSATESQTCPDFVLSSACF